MGGQKEMLRGKMEKNINKGLNTDSKTQVSHCTAPSKPPDLCHLRVLSTSSHRALWCDTTSACGSGAVCRLQPRSGYKARLLARAQSLYCSQFPGLSAKCNWQRLLLLSAALPSPLQTIPCVKHHTQCFTVCPQRADYLTSTYSVSEQS